MHLSGMVRLQLEGITHRFDHQWLFRQLSLQAEGGQVVAITGINGSGKSTLLKIVAGVLTPVEGDVRLEVQGTRIEPEDRPYVTGFVAPYLNLYDLFSARENLSFIARARGVSLTDTEIEELLDFVQLRMFADRPLRAYSSGMKQRVKLAAALLTHPPLLLLDEPRTNLDDAGRHLVDAIIARQRASGGITLLATNIPEELEGCDTVLSVMDFRH